MYTTLEAVASYATAAEAEVVCALLAASGIEAHVAGVNLARAHVPAGEIAVLVAVHDLDRAREIVADAMATADEAG